MIRGERLNKLRDSWFSAKFIEVKYNFKYLLKVKLWIGEGGLIDLTESKQTWNVNIYKNYNKNKSAKILIRKGNSPDY